MARPSSASPAPERPAAAPDRETGALIRQRATITLLVENLSEGVILLDEAGHVVDANAMAGRLLGEPVPLGINAADLARRYALATTDGVPLPFERTPALRALAGESVRASELAIERADGRRSYLSISASPVIEDELRGALLLLQDISDRVRRDREAAAFQLLSQQLTGSELDALAIYRTIVARVGEMTDADIVRLMLWDAESRALHRAALHTASGRDDHDPAIQPIESASTLDALAARTRLPVVVPDFRELPEGVTDPTTGELRAGSAVALPLLVRDELIGTLAFERPEPHAVDDAEIAFLTMVGTQCATAIHNANIFQARSRERAFLAEIIDHLPAGLVVFEVVPGVGRWRGRHDYRITMMNRVAASSLPPGVGERLRAQRRGTGGMRVRRLLGSERAAVIAALLDEAVRRGEIIAAEEVPFGGDGSERIWSGTIVPLSDRLGETRELVLLATDMTEHVASRRRIEELVQIAGTRAAELEATVSAMTDPVTVCDSGGVLRLANRAALDTYGVDSLAELLRMPSVDERVQLRHTGGEQVTREEHPLARALAGEMLQADYTLFHHRLGRDVHRRTSAAPVRDSSGAIIGAVTVETDITGLIEIDRLKDEFFSMAAHELRTPLTAMKGYVQILSRLLASEEAAAGQEPVVPRALATLRDQSDRMERLINELLDVARIETGQLSLRPREFDLAELLAQIVAEVGRSTTRHELRLRAAPESLPGRWDRDRLAQVFSNLLTNAVKYSPEGGPIDVAARLHDGEVVVTVRDEGIGIEPEAVPRLFARYSRVGQSEQHGISGLGVGLYITKQIIDSHGGSIAVQSTPGKGSTFTVTLPVR